MYVGNVYIYMNSLHSLTTLLTSIMIRHHFHSEVWQPETLTEVSIPSCSDLFQIKFQLLEVSRSSAWTEEDENVTSEESEESKLVAERKTKPLSLTQLLYRLSSQDIWVIFTGTLSSMGVPEDEQPAIVAKILEVLKVAVPFRPIYVVIKDIVTLQECNGGDESSNKARDDSLEVKEEEEEECVICLEGISDFGPNSVTQLPCKHIYHGHCIKKWQKKVRPLCSCPLCRYPIPIQEMAVEPSQLVSLLSTLSEPPENQHMHEEDIDEDPLPEPEWIEGLGCFLTTVLIIPLCMRVCH